MIGQEDPYADTYDPSLYGGYESWEPPPEAGWYGSGQVESITLPDIVAREFTDQPTGFEVTYEGETWAEAPTFDDAVWTSVNAWYPGLTETYASTPSANVAAAEYVQTVQAGGSTQGWADRWLPQIGQALVNALPSLLNRVTGNPQTGRYAVQTQRAGLGAIPWTPILIGVAALFVLPKLMRGGSRGGRRTRARRR